jgi:hypothetical protein
MPTHRHLTPAHQQTLETIFGRHATKHVEWHDLIELIESVGTVVHKGQTEYQFIVNDERHVFTRPHHDRVTSEEEIADLRSLLERARMTP